MKSNEFREMKTDFTETGSDDVISEPEISGSVSFDTVRDIFDKVIPGFDDEEIAPRVRMLEEYMDAVLDLNQHINLTAITDRAEFIRKHYADSLLCAGLDEFKSAGTIIDVGTGGGFPGIPLAVVFPEKKFVLIDSLNKRIKIINELCEKIGIKNVTAVHGRAEELARRKEMREAFDLCVSRAVANMSTLSEYCLPFVKVGGCFMAYKGPDCENELLDASHAVDVLGGDVLRIESPSYDGLDFDHRIIVIKKVINTTSRFPRKPGTPSKEPIK